MLSFVRNHWRPIVIVIALAVAFASGRFAAPDKIVTVDRWQFQTVEKRVEVKQEAKVITRDRIVKPDGTKVEHTVVTSRAVTNEHDDTASTGSEEHEKIVERSRPDWRVGVLLGVNWQGVHIVPPGVDPSAFTYGAIGERRIIGPIFVGAWVIRSGPSFGVSVSMEF